MVAKSDHELADFVIEALDQLKFNELQLERISVTLEADTIGKLLERVYWGEIA